MRKLVTLALYAALLFGAAGPASASPPSTICAGEDLIAAMAPPQRAALDAAVASVPHAQGILWQATRGDARITIVGTYHFPDPRHAPLVARLTPEIAAAAALFVEAGPQEEARLAAALAEDPTLMADTDGPTLAERLAPADWHALSRAMEARGFPAVLTSRMRPWYVATMLSLSPCMMRQAAEKGDAGGLDHQLIDVAVQTGTPVTALEPWDTLFDIFAGLSDAEEMDMIRSALPSAAHADDYATTLLNAYFKGDIWQIWEFGGQEARDAPGMSAQQVEAQMQLTQDRLMNRRNRAWIAPLTAGAQDAAKRGKAVVAAFGALHLPGEAGVLRLLERDGWTVAALPVPG